MKTVTQPLRRKIKTLFSEVIFTSLIVGFLCISFIHIMPAHADMGEMSTHASHGAPQSSCCETDGGDHTELWKSTLTAIPQGFQDLLVLIVLAVATSFVFTGFLKTPRLNKNIYVFHYRQYVREHPELLTYNKLRIAFASGILHPKLY